MCQVSVTPAVIDLAGELLTSFCYNRGVYLSNSSEADVSFSWLGLEHPDCQVSIIPQTGWPSPCQIQFCLSWFHTYVIVLGVLPPHSDVSLDVSIQSSVPGSLSLPLVCTFDSAPPLSLRVSAFISGWGWW